MDFYENSHFPPKSTPPQYCNHNNASSFQIINFVPQQEVWVIERFGKFHRTAEAGIQLVVPFLESIAYAQSLKEMTMDVPSQSGITSDNVTLTIDGVNSTSYRRLILRWIQWIQFSCRLLDICFKYIKMGIYVI